MDKQLPKKWKLSASCALAGLVVTSPAWAQSQTSDDSDREQTSIRDGVDDQNVIIVTGEAANRFGTDTVQSGSFRNKKILDVPLTIAVVPDEVLKSQQAVDMIDAVRNTAGVSTTGTGPVAYNNLTIRGIAVDTRQNFRLDGSLSMLSATAFPLEDKDRVEVLKGASALYYGFSAPSGIINLTMKRPTGDFNFFARSFGDSNGGYGQHIDIGGNLGPVGARFNGLAANLDTGIDFSTGSRYLAAGTFDFMPAHNLTVQADIEYFEKSIGEPAQFLLTPPATGPMNIPDVELLDPKISIGGTDFTRNLTSELNLLGKVIYDFSDDWNVTAYWGRSRMTRKRNNPGFQLNAAQLVTSLDPNSPTYGDGRIRFSAQQAEFENVNYAVELAGTLRFGDNIKNEILIGASRAIRTLASSPNVRTTFDQNFINPTRISEPANFNYSPLPAPSEVDDKGIYLFNRLSFYDVVDILGGIRKSDYTNDGSINQTTKTPYQAKPTAYSLGFVVKPVEWVSVYGTYIEGLEETDIAPSNSSNADQVFPPTLSTQYEAGIKLQPKRDLLIQAAYFKIDRGAAYLGPPLPGDTLGFFYTDGEERYEGGELSVTGYLTPDLALYATATILNARYRNNATIAGNRVDGAPKNTWSLAGEYRVSWFDPGLKVTAGAYHTGPQPVNAANQAFTDGFTTFDVGASYAFDFGDHQLVARVNGQNITGERYWVSVGGNSLAQNVPPSVKFSLSFDY